MPMGHDIKVKETCSKLSTTKQDSSEDESSDTDALALAMLSLQYKCNTNFTHI